MTLRIGPILGLMLLGGCATHNVAEQTDHMVSELARKSFDKEPADPGKGAISANTQGNNPADPALQVNDTKPDTDIQTASFLSQAPPKVKEVKPILTVPETIPGSEVPAIKAYEDKEAMRKELDKLYPPLPALPDEVKALPGPGGRPYTLADFQTIAVLNSPALKQAASAVKSAEGALVQARTYANPTIAYGFQPSNNGETSGVSGIYFDQKINTAGKMALQVAAARQDFLNAELAFKRARSDLATQVRTAYFAFLVAKEAVRVNRGLSILTDEIYRYQAGLLQRGGFAASYEPASLRAQAYMARYQMKTAITSYEMAWAQLVTAVGLRQLPLSEVAGRIDVNIPYFDYDTVKSYVLNKHTDILTARNGIEKARYNLKLARVTPFSDVDFNIYVGKETSLPPYQWYAQGQIGFTLPLWDQNKGNIMSAEGAFVSAKEQPHVAELNLTTNIQNAYTLYKNNLDGLEFYRRYILPDLVRAYRGVLERRRDDPNSQFGDLVAAQQGLATGVTAYLTILGNLWSSAVTVADFLQTDDMFQLANPKAIQEIPDLAKLPCCHPGSWPANGPTAPIDCGPRVPRLPSIFNVVPRHLMSGPSPDGIVLPPAPEGKP